MGLNSFTIQPAVRKETGHIALYCAVGTALLWIVIFALHKVWPEDVPFDYTVILGGIGGSAIAILNFFLMALTVQKVTSIDDDKQAAQFMRASFTRRMLLQVLWIVAALAAPCFYWIAGLVPLLFPSLGIKAAGILSFSRKSNGQEVKSEQNGD